MNIVQAQHIQNIYINRNNRNITKESPSFKGYYSKQILNKFSILSSSLGLASFGLAKLNLDNLANKKSIEARINILLKSLKKNNSLEKDTKKNLKEMITSLFYDKEVNKYNIQLLEKFILSPIFNSNNTLLNQIESLMYSTDSKTILESRNLFIDKYTSDKKLLQNKSLNIEFIDILRRITDKKTANRFVQILDTYISNPVLHKNKSITETLGHFLQRSRDYKEADAKIEVIEKFTNDTKLQNNKLVKENIAYIIDEISSPEEAEVATKFLNHNNLYNNANFYPVIFNIIFNTSNKESAEAKILMFDKYLENKELYSNPIIHNEIGKIIKTVNSKNDFDIKFNIINSFIQNDTLKNNSNVQKQISAIIKASNDSHHTLLINKIFNNKLLYNNLDIPKIILHTHSKNEAEAKIQIIDNFLNNKKLYNSNDIKNNITQIIIETKSEEEAQGNINFINKIIENNKLYDQKNIIKNIPNFLNYDTPKNLELKANFLEYYANNNILNRNKNLNENIGDITSLITDKNIDFIQTLVSIDSLDKSLIPTILDKTKFQTGTQKSLYDQDKIKKILKLLTKSINSDFIIDKINKGFDLDLVIFLSELKRFKMPSVRKIKHQNYQTRNKIENSILENSTINPLLKKYLPIINETSGTIITTKFKHKLKQQILDNIEKLTQEEKTYIESKNIDLSSIIKKLNTKIQQHSDIIPKKARIFSGFRSKSKITDLEKFVIDKFNVPETIWRNKMNMQIWGEEKLYEIQHKNYKSIKYQDINSFRNQQLQDWFRWINSETTFENDIFSKIILSDFVTNNLLETNSALPPILNTSIALETISELSHNIDNISFSKKYINKITQLTQKSGSGKEISKDGISGAWYTVAQTNPISPLFKNRVEQIHAFSAGTNWCIRGNFADSYIEEGNLHFFVDSQGLTQICIREDSPNHIVEIQKRQQDLELPMPYINLITDFIAEKNLKTTLGMKNRIEQAKESKKTLDELKNALDNNETNIQEKIFTQMGIKVTKLEDNTLKLSEYKPYIKNFNLSALGFDENILLENVSIIEGCADFSESNVTILPSLKEINGNLVHEGSKIKDMPNLKIINGKKL